MIEIQPISDLNTISPFKSEYLKQSTAPLDGMWLCGFVPMAQHFIFVQDSKTVGYCCVNDEGYLLQYYLDDKAAVEGTSLLSDMVAGKHESLPKIEGAFVSTAEPHFLSHCFDVFESFNVNALMYQLSEESPSEPLKLQDRKLTPMAADQLSEAIAFAVEAIGAPEEWLSHYYSNLIQRQELFGVWEGDKLIGTGENRKFDEVQQGYTDIGVIVGPQQRGKGLATWILQELVQMAQAQGLKPMCSTESGNLGAQKAIQKAGFLSRNRIIQFS